MDRTATILARAEPEDFTIADCVEGWFDATAWCDNGCHGRRIDLDKAAEKWGEHKILSLMREGLITCVKCKQPATFLSVSSSERAGSLLRWQLGDDAMPRQATS